MQRRKRRLYHQAKRTSNWSNYRHYQKECKRAHRRAEWSYVNETIEKGIAENNSKHFWRYVKSKKEDNMGISPLLSSGKLVSDSARKAELLSQPIQLSIYERRWKLVSTGIQIRK